MEELIQNEKFTAEYDGTISFEIPFIQTNEVTLVDGKKMVVSDESQKVLEHDYEVLAASKLRKSGATIIFGTFDNLHSGHLNMLRTARSFGNELYIGIENLEKALIRKAGKHEIQSAYDRIRNIANLKITETEKVFVREHALEDIKKLIAEGVKITTLAVGESQKDNEEMVEAVRWCLENNIQVVAIKRLRVKGGKTEISSTAIRRANNELSNGRK